MSHVSYILFSKRRSVRLSLALDAVRGLDRCCFLVSRRFERLLSRQIAELAGDALDSDIVEPNFVIICQIILF
jgi:hypothetical protein